MTSAAQPTRSLAQLPVARRSTPTCAFGGMIRRDLWVLGKQWPTLVVSTVLQPLLLVFVFTSVLPKAGFAVGGPQRAAAYSSLLVAGVIGLSAFTQGFQAVTVRFAVEFGYSNEIEDRIRAPLAIWALGLEKIIIGAL